MLKGLNDLRPDLWRLFMNRIKAKIIGTAVFAATLLFLLTFTGCQLLNIITGNGNIKTKSYDLKDFTAVSCSGKWTVHIERGADFSVKITSDENLFPFFDVFTGGDTLYVKERSTYHPVSTEQAVFITMPSLTRLNAAGTLRGCISEFNQPTTDLSLSVSGSGTITTGTLTVQNINMKISGSGIVAAHGTAHDMKAVISGFGTIKARELKTDNTDISISGSGLAEVWATTALKASISRADTIRYKGSPSITGTYPVGSIAPF